ncbi:hypothetical protein [Actinokineospora globicatena]|uniref:DNA-binding transcriptional regulator of glucitol operon n=1 Tax=Actinokineospora globicatena TaxID=103729 RepID=A0A9W6QLE7_9PSEU|nr:hypothetical protein [Actinokineospora globicatena]GLW90805.1 hypothetical protein Aglo03_16210 [Actinokineospora globicatena]
MREPPGVGRKLLVVGVSLLALVLCCGLAWWQWQRFSSANGTFQNLGYVLQWPLFGLAPAYMFWRLRKLKLREQAEAEQRAAEPGQTSEPEVQHEYRTAEHGKSAEHSTAVERSSVLEQHGGGDDEDDELAAYNRYLARLNQESR